MPQAGINNHAKAFGLVKLQVCHTVALKGADKWIFSPGLLSYLPH
jgi:hypothetical protein